MGTAQLNMNKKTQKFKKMKKNKKHVDFCRLL